MLSVTGANFTPDNGSVIYNDLAVLLQTCPGPSFCLCSAHGAARAPAAGEHAWCWQTSEQGRISAGASHLAGMLWCQASHSELLFVNAAYGVLGLCHAHLAALRDIFALLQLLVAVWPHESVCSFSCLSVLCCTEGEVSQGAVFVNGLWFFVVVFSYCDSNKNSRRPWSSWRLRCFTDILCILLSALRCSSCLSKHMNFFFCTSVVSWHLGPFCRWCFDIRGSDWVHPVRWLTLVLFSHCYWWGRGRTSLFIWRISGVARFTLHESVIS